MTGPLLCLAALWLAGPATSPGEPAGWQTDPGRWSESRLFHTPFESRYEGRVRLGRRTLAAADSRLVAPNGAYWASVSPAGSCEAAASGVACLILARDVRLAVFTERDYLLSLELLDRYPNFQLSIRWVSEKLLFVRVWWGRVLGTDLVLDVEREEFVCREMLHDGTGPFVQERGREP